MLQEKLHQKTVKVQNLNNITLKTDVLNILINKSEDNDFIISVEYNYILDKESATDDDKLPGTLTVDELNNSISYELYIHDLKQLHCSETFLKANTYIEIPEDTKVSIQNESGNISIENISCDFNIKSENGVVSMINAGSGAIKTVNGDVTLKNISNNFDIKTTNGLIQIENGIGGVLKAVSEVGDIKIIDVDYSKVLSKSEKGDLRVEMCHGISDRVELKSLSGDISFSMDDFGCQNILLSAEDGDIKIFLQKDKMVNLDLTSDLGKIKCKVNTKNAYEEIIDSNRFYLSFSDDISNIMAKTIKGDIFVNEFDNNNSLNSTLSDDYDFSEEDEIDEIVDEIVDYIDGNIDIIDSEIDRESVKYKIWKLKNITKDQMSKENIYKVWDKIRDTTSKIGTYIKNDSDDDESIIVDNSEAVMKILDMVEKKIISVDEAERLLKSMRNNSSNSP